jgi:hypothetical protein
MSFDKKCLSADHLPAEIITPDGSRMFISRENNRSTPLKQLAGGALTGEGPEAKKPHFWPDQFSGMRSTLPGGGLLIIGRAFSFVGEYNDKQTNHAPSRGELYKGLVGSFKNIETFLLDITSIYMFLL